MLCSCFAPDPPRASKASELYRKLGPASAVGAVARDEQNPAVNDCGLALNQLVLCAQVLTTVIFMRILNGGNGQLAADTLPHVLADAQRRGIFRKRLKLPLGPATLEAQPKEVRATT